ncbi:MAG: LLM class F420-dependent oxidoreductase [Chloroflexi bacterium]|nr:LLM class F420-dependent oxidoreductase [Chloroflexota bacterium]
MRVGAVLPQLEIGAHPNGITRYATTVERLGYQHIVAYDHVLGAHPDRAGGWRGPYTHVSLFHEPFVLFGYVAAIAPQLELVPSVIVLPQRQTALVAKQAAEVDVLSQGKLRFGIGIGWNFVEFEALGQKFTDRGKRMEEQIAVLRRLWTEEVVDFTGRWHRIDRAGINPLPVQRPIPIWMGGTAEPAVRRIAALGDGWLTQAQPNDEGRAAFAQFRGFVGEAGRDPERIGIEGRINARRGTPTEWIEGARIFADMGCTHIELNTMGAGYATIDAHLDALARFREGLRGAGLDR